MSRSVGNRFSELRIGVVLNNCIPLATVGALTSLHRGDEFAAAQDAIVVLIRHHVPPGGVGTLRSACSDDSRQYNRQSPHGRPRCIYPEGAFS